MAVPAGTDFPDDISGHAAVFYGDELGITGIEEADYRQAMPWKQGMQSKSHGRKKNSGRKSFVTEIAPILFLLFMRSLIQLRRKEGTAAKR